MQNTRPQTIRIIIWMLALRVLFMPVIIFAFYLVKDAPIAERSFRTGVRDAIVSRFHLNLNDTWYALGALTGSLLIPVLLAVLTLAFVIKRKLIPAVVCMGFGILFALGQKGLPVFPVVVMVLLFSSSAKKYFKNEPTIEQEPLVK